MEGRLKGYLIIDQENISNKPIHSPIKFFDITSGKIGFQNIAFLLKIEYLND